MEDDTSTGGEATAAEDTSNTGESAQVTDETGGVSQEEISAALGPKYSAVTPAKEAEESEGKEVEGEGEATAAEDEQEVEEEAPAKTDTQEVAATDGKDFSFTVEDANGTTYKVSPGDSIEDILKDFEPKNNGQIIAILDQLREAKDSQAKYEAEQKDEADQADRADRVANIQQGWNDEIKSLQADKRIPVTVKGKDNERVAEVYTFMAAENTKRIEAGRPTIGSFEDALDKLENIEGRQAKVEADKAEKETARKNGALVGGSSAPASNAVPVYKAGSARNVNQALRAQGLL